MRGSTWLDASTATVAARPAPPCDQGVQRVEAEREHQPVSAGGGQRRWPALAVRPRSEYRSGHWWSYTFVPPGPGHPRPTVAVGCEAGVVVFDLETGRRTRLFAGHSSPVVSVVPSPDGRWLASSSIDQTIMLYPLAGCDTTAGPGRYVPAAGRRLLGGRRDRAQGASPPPWACRSATCSSRPGSAVSGLQPGTVYQAPGGARSVRGAGR